MPQLIPDPWFYIFILIWLIFILILPSKINNYKMFNKLNSRTINMHKTTWPWPWT
uniref:ATP synthase complex subunit 8 n=1 Tax=Hyperolius marmoratus TaxID=476017 RepID=W0TL85_HYPMR|nr:ATP synthase F0 subunit 8 [Hyperolius marmoratus]BAO42914.1 ATPase subunit 8 [Hyperolius marmoratus]